MSTRLHTWKSNSSDRIVVLAVAVFLTFAFTGCGGGGGGGGSGGGTVTVAAPTGTLARAGAGDGKVTVEWAAVSGAASYNLYWSTGNTVDTTTGTQVTGVTSPHVFSNLTDGETFAYIITAVNATGESAPSAVTTATTRAPKISGTVSFPPGLYVTPGGGFNAVCMYDLTWTQVGTPQTHCSATEAFEFEANRGQVYILLADYKLSNENQAQAYAALTPTVTADLTQDVDLDSEVAFNLVTVVEHELNGLDLADLQPLATNVDALLGQANQLVANLNAFYTDRNLNRDADRFVDAVRNYTLDRLNLNSSVAVSTLARATIRAYGGGMGAVRTMDEMLDTPQTPYNPHFIFERNTGSGTLNVSMSDMDANRWDYLFDDAFGPHMATGGDKLAFTAYDPVGGATNAGGFKVLSLWVKTLGDTTRTKLTPQWMHVGKARISPDQTKVVFSGYTADPDGLSDTVGAAGLYNLWTVNLDGTGLTALTPERTYLELQEYCPVASIPQGDLGPDWAPDMSTIVFQYFRVDGCTSTVPESSLDTITPDGTGRTTLLNLLQLPGWLVARNPRWAPDGSEILFETLLGDNDLELIAISYPDFLDTQNNVIYYPYTNNTDRDVEGSYSYDGRFIIFCSDRNKDTDGTPTITGFEIQPVYVLNRYTGEVFNSYGNFAAAGYYGNPQIVATEAVLVAVDTAATDASGDVIVGGTDNRTSGGGSSSTYNYYREIIPSANSIGVNFNVTSW